MPQQLLHYLELSPHTSQQSRVGVPEGMPSEPLLNSESSRHGTNVFAQDRLAPVWSSASVTPACENPILGLDVGTSFLHSTEESLRVRCIGTGFCGSSTPRLAMMRVKTQSSCDPKFSYCRNLQSIDDSLRSICG